ncbi:MAG: DNA-deoxyinosine glycosylase [Lachnospiraceae bacterium]|nr:DNA-deoxyinosine glycosylase [Lachnospiraceae bacterium]
MKEHIIHPIPPLYDKESKILILGSFPSVRSREQMFFYGHPQNRFWKVLASVFSDREPETVPEKKTFLRTHHVALWDVIGSCDIVGSSDSSIENVTANDISKILKEADIRGIFVNGKTAEKYYKRYIEPKTGRKAVCLPSTSPANAAWSADKLVLNWGRSIGSALGPEGLISELFETRDLGKVQLPITPVAGGFMHRMYKVKAKERSYAVKHLNPAIMERPEALNNYKRAEELEQILEDAGLPVITAMTICGTKMQKICGDYFYVFRWQEGKITDWNNITIEQCIIAGKIQGKIHSIGQTKASCPPELSTVEWDDHIKKAKAVKSEIASYLEENRDLLYEVREELNKARKNLPDIETIIDEDMDPKNVMWNNGNPSVIDLECLDRGNPVSSAVQLSLQWAGITSCELDLNKIKAFFEGYLAVYDNGFKEYDSVFGLAYTWIEWLEYNITRSLGQCMDEDELKLGITEVKTTLSRIRYIHEKENDIRQILRMIFAKEN